MDDNLSNISAIKKKKGGGKPPPPAALINKSLETLLFTAAAVKRCDWNILKGL